MDSSLESASSVPSLSPSVSSSLSLSSDSQKTPTRVHFQAGDDVLLLCEVLAVKHPFVRRSSCWEDIAVTLQSDVSTNFTKVTACTLRECATNLTDLMEASRGYRGFAKWYR